MWVEELSDAAWPLGGFTRACNKCYSCRIGIHHSDLFGIHHSDLFGKVLPHGLCRMYSTRAHASKTVVRKVHEMIMLTHATYLQQNSLCETEQK